MKKTRALLVGFAAMTLLATSACGATADKGESSGTSDKPDENEKEIMMLDRDFRECGLRRVHTSYLSSDLGVAAIWQRE